MQKVFKRLSVWAVVVAAILMIPLLFKWPWTGGDYVFGAVLLFGAATIYEVSTRNIFNRKHRVAIAISVLLVLGLIWGWAATGA